MREIICDKCKALFTPDMVELHREILMQDEKGEDIEMHFFDCPMCGKRYVITITDRTQRLMIQKRRQLQAAAQNAIKAGLQKKAQRYKDMERELADDLIERAEELKRQQQDFEKENNIFEQI